VLAGAGYRVVASDLVAYDDAVFPIASGVDALQAPLPPGVRTIATNPPYNKLLLPKLVRHWLGILNPVGGQLCLLLRVLWGECKVAPGADHQTPGLQRQAQDAAANPMVRGHVARQAPADEGGTRLVPLGLAQGFNAAAL
jgi:hypothetical protein